MKKTVFYFVICAVVAVFTHMMAGASAPEDIDRTVLPIPEPERPTYSELDVRNVEAPPFFEVKAPRRLPTS